MLEQSATRFCPPGWRVFAFGNGDGSAIGRLTPPATSPGPGGGGLCRRCRRLPLCDQQRPVPLVVLPGFDGGVGPWVERYGWRRGAVPSPWLRGDGHRHLTAVVYLGCEGGRSDLPDAEQALLNDAIWAFLAATPHRRP